MLLLLVGLGNVSGLLMGLLIICIVLGAAYWLITNLLPEPMRKWAIGVVIVICAILLIKLLTGGALL